MGSGNATGQSRKSSVYHPDHIPVKIRETYSDLHTIRTSRKRTTDQGCPFLLSLSQAINNASAAINKLQEVNVYTAAENMKKMADGDLYITSTKEVRDTELFMARAQSIRNELANTYDIPAGRIFIEKNPAVIASLDPQKSCVIVYINE